jgi:hypothetical protein
MASAHSVGSHFVNFWFIIVDSVRESINYEMKRKCKTINQKLQKLGKIQIFTPEFHKTFFPRVVNNTSVIVTHDELALLNKGFKYNLSHKRKDWIKKNLALEAETAISKLPVHEQDYLRFQVAHNIKQLYRQYNGN